MVLYAKSVSIERSEAILSKNEINLVVTDFSEVKLGPKWEWFIRTRTEGLKRDGRTKEYKRARQTYRDIERAINILAWYEWAHGGVLEKLP